MCGRYALFGPFTGGSQTLVEGWVEHIHNPLAGFARYNIAPSQSLPVVTWHEGRPGLEDMRWGLLPHWARDAKLAYSTINARIEGLAAKPAFRDAWRQGQRCLVPATGWYEWKDEGGKRKQPYFLHSAGGMNPLLLAGLWSRWRDGEGRTIATYTVLTTPALGAARDVHDRQPRVLEPGEWRDWLAAPVATAAELLQPREVPLAVHAVGLAVGNPRNEGPGLVEKLG